jgi:hypothetical protein
VLGAGVEPPLRSHCAAVCRAARADPERGVFLGVRADVARAVHRDGQSTTIQDRSALQEARDFAQARVVLRPDLAVCLPRPRLPRHDVAAVPHLHEEGAAGGHREQGRHHQPDARRGNEERLLLGWRRLSRRREQQADHREVRHHRGSAKAEERRDHAGERQQAEQAADDEQRLGSERGDEADHQQRDVGLIGPPRDPQRAHHQRREQGQRHHDSGEAQDLAQTGEDQIVLTGRDVARARLGQPAAQQAARGQGPQRVRDLVAAADAVVPRRFPHVDALDDGRGVADGVGGGERSDQRRQSQRRQAPAIAGDAVGDEEGAGQDERRAEVALEEEEQQHQRHADGDGNHVGDAGKVQPLQDRVLPRQRIGQLAQPFPAPREVAGEEDRDERPDRLDRLHAEKVHLDAAAARAGAEHHQQHRQAERGDEEHEGEAVQLESREVDEAGRGQGDAAERHADRERLEEQPLPPRIVDAGHGDQAEAAQRAGDRQQPRVADGAAKPPHAVREEEADRNDGGGSHQRRREDEPRPHDVGVSGRAGGGEVVAGGHAADGEQEGGEHGGQCRQFQVGPARVAVPDAARRPACRCRDAA